MGTKVLSYEGFQGSIEVSVDDNCLYGRLLHIDDLVTYEGDTPDQLKSAFEDSVREYVALCVEEGREPNKPFKGSLNIRIGSDLHEKAAKKAAELDVSLNDFIRDALSDRLGNVPVVRTIQEIHHHEHSHYSISAGSDQQFDYTNDNGHIQWQQTQLAYQNLSRKN